MQVSCQMANPSMLWPREPLRLGVTGAGAGHGRSTPFLLPVSSVGEAAPEAAPPRDGAARFGSQRWASVHSGKRGGPRQARRGARATQSLRWGSSCRLRRPQGAAPSSTASGSGPAASGPPRLCCLDSRLFHCALLCARWLSMFSDRVLFPVNRAHSRKSGSTM